MSASDAAYVRGDTDITKAVEILSKGAFFNSGQSRNAIKRIYVDAKRLDEFCHRFVEEVKTFRYGLIDVAQVIL